MFMRKLSTTVGLLLAVTTYSPLSKGQTPGALLTGRVTDSTKAVISDARLLTINVGTNIRYEGVTNSAGEYYVPNLPPGTYRIEAQKAGFNTVVKPNVVLHIEDAVEINIEMTVGSTSESITVAAGAPTVQFATSDIGAVVDAATIRELPLNGRSWTDLAVLQPGVVGVETQINYTSGSGRGNRGFGSQLSISGGRPEQNSYRLDGVNLNEYTNGGPGSVLGGTLGVDAIEEFSVLTADYSAEYGRTSGGIISAVTRSGTNELHGSAYEFLRNSALDARNFFDPAGVPSFKRNQFGGAVGGPIWKNRTFFFADYEGVRQSKGITNIATVPSAAARSGHLSTGDVTVDPSAAQYLTFWPLPNGRLLGSGDTGLYTFAGQQVVNENFVTSRIDHRLTGKDSLSGVYSYDTAPYSAPDDLNDVLLGSHTIRHTAVLQDTHVFSAALVNTLRVGFNRDTAQNNISVQAINPAAADPSLAAIPGAYAALVSVGGLSPFRGGLNGGSPWLYAWNSYQVYDDALFTHGRHSLKFGFSFERMQSNMEAFSDVDGGFSFGNLQAFLTNTPARLVAALPGHLTPRGLRESLAAGYVQDDWHFSPNLTLNLGLRYEMTTVPTEVQGKLSNLIRITDSQPHLGSPLFHNPTFANFEPRVGLAWDPWGTGRTVIRAGFGLYDVLPLPYQFSLMETRTAPFFTDGTTSKLPPGSFYKGAVALLSPDTLSETYIEQNPKRNYVMQWAFNVQHQLAQNLTVSAAYVGSRGVHQPVRIDDGNIVLPVSTDAGFVWPTPVGSGTPINPQFGQIRTMQWEGNSIYHALELNLTQRLTHGLQLRGSYTWGKSIDTTSAAIAGDDFINAMSSPPAYNLKAIRGLSDFNIGQTLVLAGTWRVPEPGSLTGPLAWTANGWELSAILKANTGVPFTPTLGTGADPLGLNSSDPWDFPSVVTGSGCSSLVNSGNPNEYIKTQCFSLPSAPSQAFYSQYCDASFAYPTCINLRGNAGRNILTGPGLTNLDFSLVKNNRISRVSETLNLQFRAEVFNLLNHTNFQVPTVPDNTDIFDSSGTRNPSAGLLTSTTTNSRQIQFGLKVIW
jgi:Carboxypeptidase regulatory-like domain/TonB dependent receptor-like, beta-barrel/TonB-dependent Receptor Plug Domain